MAKMLRTAHGQNTHTHTHILMAGPTVRSKSMQHAYYATQGTKDKLSLALADSTGKMKINRKAKKKNKQKKNIHIHVGLTLHIRTKRMNERDRVGDSVMERVRWGERHSPDDRINNKVIKNSANNLSGS